MYQYEFTSWDISYDNVTEDLVVTAEFDEVLRKYKVTFIVNNKTYREVDVEYGKEAQVSDPKQAGYNFIGWDKNISNVYTEMKVYAKFNPIKYDIYFDNGYKEGDIMEVIGEMSPILEL